MTHRIPASEANLRRSCPVCSRELKYKSYNGYYTALSTNSLCNHCCQKKAKKHVIVSSEKECIKCKIVKPLQEFHNLIRSPDGKQATCKKCQNIYKLEWNRQHPERMAATRKRHRDKDPEAYNEYHRSWKKAHWPEAKKREVVKRYRLRQICDLSLEQEDYILNWTEGPCPICRRHMSGRGSGIGKAHVDHDHQTNRFRDLICSSCNSLLGYAKDSESTLLAAADYIRRHKSEQSSVGYAPGETGGSSRTGVGEDGPRLSPEKGSNSDLLVISGSSWSGEDNARAYLC